MVAKSATKLNMKKSTAAVLDDGAKALLAMLATLVNTPARLFPNMMAFMYSHGNMAAKKYTHDESMPIVALATNTQQHVTTNNVKGP